jgi:hypothetical protein
MLKECIENQPGLHFHHDYLLEELGLDLGGPNVDPAKHSDPAQHFDPSKVFTSDTVIQKHQEDVVAQIFDQLILAFFWWLLEFIPLLHTYQKPDGSWVRQRS